ncbi:MAG: CPBP family glutamic-type intramembrane protease [Planctomycetota bacterium]
MLKGDALAWHADSKRLRWLVFAGPLLVYFAIGSGRVSASVLGTCLLQFTLMCVVLAWSIPRACRGFPFKLSGVSIAYGCVGAFLWIVLCRMQLESKVLVALGLSPDWLGSRPAINPWEVFPDTPGLLIYLAARLSVLILAVPIAEELFLRGCLMRCVEQEDWDELPLKGIGSTGVMVGTLYGVLAHPAEWIAAAIWFSWVTWMMLRTGRFWDCVVVHVITNAALGAYIIIWEDWRLW